MHLDLQIVSHLRLANPLRLLYNQTRIFCPHCLAIIPLELHILYFRKNPPHHLHTLYQSFRANLLDLLIWTHCMVLAPQAQTRAFRILLPKVLTFGQALTLHQNLIFIQLPVQVKF